VKRWRPSGLELALLAVIVLVIAGAAVIGAGESDESGSSGAGATATAPGPHVKVAPIERRVERLRGLRFRKPLKIVFAAPRRAQALLRAASESEYGRREQLIDEESLKLLGLLDPSARLDRYLRAIEREQVLGFYDERSERLVVVTGKANRSVQEITLAHELVHALEDQHYGVRRKAGLSGDRALAESALFEGTATALMTDYATRYMDLGDALEVLGGTGTDTKLPPFLEDLLLFPYLEGERFVDAFRLRDSWRAVNNVMAFRRPRSTEQVIHPAKYAVGERPVAVEAPVAVRPILGAGWRRLRATEIGELDLEVLFEHVGEVKNEEAAAGWGGGRFELWRKTGKRSCAAPCVSRDAGVISLAWDTRADRVDGEAAFRRVFERGLKGKRLAASAGVGLWSSRGGAIGMRGGGTRTTVTLAPSASLVAPILASSRAGGTARLRKDERAGSSAVRAAGS
jgi:hypothetical protein